MRHGTVDSTTVGGVNAGWTNADFAATLLDPTRPVPPGWASRPGADTPQRLNVHRNNVVHSLVVALGEAFPVCREFVGAEYFDALAAGFVRAHPPRSPVLAEWGAELPRFIEGFAPAAAVPALADLARLEWARQCAWHAADSPAPDLAQLAAALARPDALPGARLQVHPSLHPLVLHSAAVSIWAAHQGAGRLEDIDPSQPEAAWVLRPADEVLVVPVRAAQAAWALAVQRGATFGEAAAHASRSDDPQPFDLATTLALAVQHGLLCSLDFPRTTP
jgi:hypothetical protein